MKTVRKRTITLLLSLVLLLAALPVSASADTVSFPDVPEDAWYGEYLDKIIYVQQLVGQMNIISGLYNDDNVLVFEPERSVKRGEWLKMLFEAAESSGNQISFRVDQTQSAAHWAGKYYTKAQDDNVLVADVYSSTEPMFPCTAEALDQPITRYEMAVILNNVCTNISMQKMVVIDEPETHITDYAVIPDSYKTAVEQMYGKGLLTGFEDGHFGGDETLTRAQAVTVLYRYLFVDTIQGDGLQEWAAYPKEETTAPALYDPSLSFANWLRSGHVDAYGNIDAAAKLKLFGNANKSYFSSAAEAAPHMTTVSVPIWTLDKAGNKVPSTCAITVNKAVEYDVRGIFWMIYNDPEQFPIYGGWSAGGARYTDHLRHSWGCAIDINAYYNCECTINWNTYYNRVTCGYGWWPQLKNANNRPYGASADTTFAGTMSSASPYSIGKTEGQYGYSVVKAFAAYGWGWGGNGYSKHADGTQKFDYMHFSVLPSGG